MKTISKSDVLKLRGILAVSEHHVSALRDLQRAAAEVLGLDPDEDSKFRDHISDTIYGGQDFQSVGRLLQALDIAVEKPKAVR